MGTPNENWGRWIFASISKAFKTIADANNLYMFIEGTDRQTRDQQDFIEFRFDGPYISELSKGVWKLYVEVNVLVQSVVKDDRFHDIHKDCGVVSMMFTSGMPIYRYGDGPEDDDSLLGCMTLIADGNRERIQISHFGQINPSVRLMQATVEGHYEMKLVV